MEYDVRPTTSARCVRAASVDVPRDSLVAWPRQDRRVTTYNPATMLATDGEQGGTDGRTATIAAAPAAHAGRSSAPTGSAWRAPSSSGASPTASMTAAEVILTCPWEATSMTIADLLMSQRRWGRTRCRKFLASIPMSETKTIGSMTERQRETLAALLTAKKARPGPTRTCWSTRAGSPAWRERSDDPSGAEGRRAASLRSSRGRPRRGDLDDVAVGVAQVDRAKPPAVEHLGALDAARAQVVAPRVQLLGRRRR